MPTRTPSANNPFLMPAEYADYPLLYKSLIRPIREADYKEGREFLRRFYIGIQEQHNAVADLIASAWDNQDPVTCPEDLLTYLKDIVGWDSKYDYITDRLSTNDLRKLIKVGVPFWKRRFSTQGLVDIVRFLTGRTAIYYDWFYWRAITGETFLSEEQLGYDFWLIGGNHSYQDENLSQLRLMDDGTLDRQLVLDLAAIHRPSGERLEIAIVDFLDQFDLSRDRWTTLAGTAATVTTDKTFSIPAGTTEQATSVDASDSVMLHKFMLEAGAALYTYFNVKGDFSDGTYYRVEAAKDYIQLTRWFNGASEILSTPTLGLTLQETLWYKLRASTVESLAEGSQLLADGDMEFKGSQLLADGDMEFKGAQLLADGDMEFKGSQELVDGDFSAELTDIIVDGWMENGPGSEELTDGTMEAGAGAEELTDGDMEVTTEPAPVVDGDAEAAGTGAWTPIGSPTLTKESGSPGGSGSQVFRITYNGTSYPSAQQNVLTVGKYYHVTGWARADGAAWFPRISLGSTSAWNGTNSNVWQAIDVYATCTSTGVLDLKYVGTSAGWVEFDDIVITDEMPYWTAGAGATLTKETGTPYEGSQVLRNLSSGANAYAAQTALTVNKTYRVTGVARSDGTGVADVRTGAATVLWTGTTSTSWQAFDVTFSADHADIYLYNNTSGQYVEFDDVSIVETAPAWVQTLNGVVSKSTDNPQQGSQALRVAYNGSSYPSAYQATLTVGRSYRMTGWMRGDGASGRPMAFLGGGETAIGTTSSAWQAFDITGRAVDANAALVYNDTVAGWVEFDGVSVKETAPVWDPANSPVISKETADPYQGVYNLRVTYDGVANCRAEQTILSAGVAYRVTGWARGDGASSVPRVYIGTGTPDWTGTDSTTWQAIDVVAIADNNKFGLLLSTGTGYVEFDHIEVTKIDLSAWASPSFTLLTGAGGQDGTGWALNVAWGGAANPYAEQTVLSIGETYRVTGWARGDGTKFPTVQSNGVNEWIGTSSTSWQAIDVTFVAAATDLRLVNVTGGAGWCEFDTILVTNDVPDWGISSAALLSKETTSPHGGTYVLRSAIATPDTAGSASQTILTIGKTYRVVGWGRGDGVNGKVAVGNVTTTDLFLGTVSGTWQPFDFSFVATGTTLLLGVFDPGGVGSYAEFDDVTITEDAPSWVSWRDALLSKETGDPGGGGGSQVIRVSYTVTANCAASQAITTSGKTYRVTGWARGDGTFAPQVQASTVGVIWAGSSSTSWQQFDVSFVAAGATILLYTVASAAGWAEFDGVVVTEDCPSWVDNNDAVMSKEIASPHGGTYALRVAYDGTANPYVGQTSLLTAGQTYHMTGWARGDGTAKPRVYLGSGSPVWTGTSSTSWQYFDVTAAAVFNSVLLQSEVAVAGYCEFDDIIVATSPEREIKVYLDGNRVIDMTDAHGGPNSGGLAVASKAAGGVVEVDNVELFRAPMRFATIGPPTDPTDLTTGIETSDNFFT